MTYEIQLSRQALSDLKKIPKKYAQSIVLAIDSLSEDPRPSGVKKLSNGSYRIRKGTYRIIYDILDKEIIIYVLKVQHRKEVYKER